MDAVTNERSRGLVSEHVRNAPVPVENRPSREEAEAAVRALIAYLGDNPAREGLRATPKRVVAALDELYRGYREIPAEALIRTFGETEPYDDFILVRDIAFTSHCEHHMLPFYGKSACGVSSTSSGCQARAIRHMRPARSNEVLYPGDNDVADQNKIIINSVTAKATPRQNRGNPLLVKTLIRTFGETEPYDDFILVRDIAFTSHCEHHMLPFYGKAHVAYRPVERVVGLSKLARLVDVYARRLQTQEHLTSQVATAIDEVLKPRGVAVLIEAEHTCMSIRGVTKPGISTVTTRFLGTFHDSTEDQVRFVTLVRGVSSRT